MVSFIDETEEILDIIGVDLEKELNRLGVKVEYGAKSKGLKPLKELATSMGSISDGSYFRVNTGVVYTLKGLVFGQYGGYVNWGDGTNTITQKGKAESLTHEYTDGKTEHIIIISGLKSLEDSAFLNDSNIKRVSLKDTITSIGASTFKGSSLERIYLPDSIDYIGVECFMNCTKLNRVHIPSKLVYLPESCFDGCEGLSNVWLGDKLQFLGERCFASCVNLKQINCPSTLLIIDTDAFKNCLSLNSILLNDGLKEIRNECFKSLKLTDVVLPSSITLGDGVFKSNPLLTRVEFKPTSPMNIGEETFLGCTNLKSVVLENIREFKTNSFTDCFYLEHITIPSSTTVLEDCFQSCHGLKYIIFKGDNPPVISKECFVDCNKDIVAFVPSSSVRKYNKALSNVGTSFIIKTI